MKMVDKSQKGFSAVEALLILVIVGIVGGLGWYVWDANEDSKNSLSKSSQAEQKKTESSSSKWKWYENKNFGFKFSYPESYGTASIIHTTEGDGPKSYTITFSAFPKETSPYVIKFAEKGYETLGVGSVCNLGLTVAESTYKALDVSAESWQTSRQLLNLDDITAVETVSWADPEANAGMCPDAQIEANKKLGPPSKIEVITVSYAERTKQADKLKSQADYTEAYKANPSDFISDKTRNTVLDIAKSATPL